MRNASRASSRRTEQKKRSSPPKPRRTRPTGSSPIFNFSASAELLQTYFEMTPSAVFIGRTKGTIDYANPAACAMFGYSFEELISMSGFSLIDATDPIFMSYIDERARTGRARGEFELIRRDGTRFMGDTSSAILKDHDGHVQSIVIIRDISESRKAEKEKNQLLEQLRELTRQQLDAREEERTSVAREIHDELGQALTALYIDLSLISKRLLPEQADLSAKILDMQTLVQATTKKVQRISADLRPDMLDELGLVPAIEWQLQQFAERTGLSYQLHVDHDDISIERQASTAMFRILQEALTNVIRHAQASHVTVRLMEELEHIVLMIMDNGKGIEDPQISNSHGLGLVGMRERAAALGGRIEIARSPGEGMTVVAKIPRTSASQGGL